MQQKPELVRINIKYCEYLRKFDNKVSFNTKAKELRPFVGILFSINEIKYFAPLSSPKPKHKLMKRQIDILKIDNGNLGIINFNNMIPVLEKNIKKIDLNYVGSSYEEIRYYKLLNKQIFWLNRNKDKLYKIASTLYTKHINKKLYINVHNRCCDFKLLEEKCLIYDNI